jgi:hypothetical protein
MYETKGLLNHYKFTSKIFALVNLTPNTAQNEPKQGVKMNHNNKQYEQKKNITYFNKNEGVTYKTPEQTKADYEQSVQTDGKSPLNDRETALKWMNSVTPITLQMKPIQNMLRQVEEKWGLNVTKSRISLY